MPSNTHTDVAAVLAIAMTLAAMVLLDGGTAHACSLEQRPQPMRIMPGTHVADVPKNVVFSPPASHGELVTSRYYWAVDGTPIDVEQDRSLSEMLAFEAPYGSYSSAVYRPVEPLQPGDVIAPCYADSCGEAWATVTDTVDETPPTRPRVDSIQVTLYDDPYRGAGTFCPELDYIELDISSSDDTTPLERLRVLIYAAPDRASVEALDSPDAAVEGEVMGDAPDRLRVDSWLGLDAKRDPYYSPLSRGADVCFSVATMDWAGNVSERSEIQCVNTRDRGDERTRVIEGAGCGCSSAADEPKLPAGILLAALGLLGLRLRLTQNRS